MNKLKKILVIDDDLGILEGFEAILQENGYKVTTSTNATSIFTLISSSKPDLILLDILLLGVDGRDVCIKIKQNSKTKHIPIIMISAHPKVKKDLQNTGASDFLSKPFEMDELLQMVKKYSK